MGFPASLMSMKYYASSLENMAIFSLHQARGEGKHKPSRAGQAGGFLHTHLTENKRTAPGGEMSQICARSAPNLHKVQPSRATAFPPSSLMSPQKAALVPASLFPTSPSPEVLAGCAACPQGESCPKILGYWGQAELCFSDIA